MLLREIIWFRSTKSTKLAAMRQGAFSLYQFYAVIVCNICVSFVIRHIPSSTDVKNIKVKAVNAVGLVGEAAVITAAGGVVTTKECSRCIAVRKELESVLKNPNEFIDTDFYSVIIL